MRVEEDGAEVKSPQGSLLSTGERDEEPPVLTGALSRPPNRSKLELGVAETGLITELGAGRTTGNDEAPGGGGKRSGPAPRLTPARATGLSFLRSMLRLTRMV